MVELSCCAQKAQWKTIQKRREFMDRFFHVTEKGSTVRTEIMAGITTFMAMAYILMVNADVYKRQQKYPVSTAMTGTMTMTTRASRQFRASMAAKVPST